MGWEGPMTQRHFEVWEAWLDREWNKPNRSDHYLMRVMHEVKYQGVKEKPSVSLKERYGIKFEFSYGPPPVERSQDEVNTEAARMAESVWCGYLGLQLGEYTNPEADRG